MDKSSGIYIHRWGDAPLKSMTVFIFANISQVQYFETIGYHHDDRFHCPKDGECDRDKLGRWDEHHGPCPDRDNTPICRYSWIPSGH